MKTYEFIQKGFDGGFPVPSGHGFEHGDACYVVQKRELFSLLYRALDMLTCCNDADEVTRNEMVGLLMGDKFLDRTGLGELSQSDIDTFAARLKSEK